MRGACDGNTRVLSLVVGSLRGGVASAGGIDKLVALLSASSGKARAAAAMALYHLCIASPEFCSDTFTSLCNAMLHARGEAAVLAALEPIYSAGGAEGLAATYLTNVSAAITHFHGARTVETSSGLPYHGFVRTSRLL